MDERRAKRPCLTLAGLAVLGAALSGCAGLPRVQFRTAPFDPGYAAFMGGEGHVNPEDPGLPNGGG